MRCRGLQRLANAAYLEGFPFPALLRVAPYCVPGGVRVVSTSPSYPHNTAVHVQPFVSSNRAYIAVIKNGFLALITVTPSSRDAHLRGVLRGLRPDSCRRLATSRWPSNGSGRRARWSPGRCTSRARSLLPLRPQARTRLYRVGDLAALGIRRAPLPQELAPGSPRRALPALLLYRAPA